MAKSKRPPQSAYDITNSLVAEFGRLDAIIVQRIAELPANDHRNQVILEWRLAQVRAAFRAFLDYKMTDDVETINDAVSKR